MSRRSFSRSNSSSSTLSCITVANNSRPAPALPQLSTPPTSVTDVASISSGTTTKDQTPGAPTNHARRVKSNVTTYNENALADSARKIGQKGGRLARNASSATLLRDNDNSESPNRRDVPSPTLDRADGQSLQATIALLKSEGSEEHQTRTLRARLARSASSALIKTTSTLGKRSHDAIEAGKDKIQSIGKRSALRSSISKRSILGASEDSLQKRQKPSLPVSEEAVVKPVSRPKRKRYLAQGLYVGQEPDFDPRLKESKNKSRTPLRQTRRKILPPLMFAGKSLLDQGRNFRLPFNIFSPLPPGQPKPEEWRKIQKNVFVGDATEFWKTSKKLEHSTCICQPESGCDENCFNRFMFYECDENNCNIGPDQCTNRSFEDLRKRCKKGGKYNVGVEVIKTADRGYGVRSNRTFEPNQIIVEYTGEIITQDECDHRMRKEYKNNECFYLMVFDQNMIIDATRGSIARFVNHACEPNCKMVKWTVAGKPRMALFAGEKGIMTGEELTYDYNFDPFSSKNIQECRCGAPSCRGVLGPKPKEVKDTPKLPAQSGTKRKLQETIEGAKDVVQSLVAKKRRVAVPKSIKDVVSTAKKASMHFTGNRSAIASTGHGARAQQASHRPQRGVMKSRARMSVGKSVTFKRRGKTNQSTTTKIIASGRQQKAQQTISSVRANAVRTIRGANRTAGNSKSIRVIS